MRRLPWRERSCDGDFGRPFRGWIHNSGCAYLEYIHTVARHNVRILVARDVWYCKFDVVYVRYGVGGTRSLQVKASAWSP